MMPNCAICATPTPLTVVEVRDGRVVETHLCEPCATVCDDCGARGATLYGDGITYDAILCDSCEEARTEAAEWEAERLSRTGW